jgi:LmbE family N-acetylglucosaminyl deacetylase
LAHPDDPEFFCGATLARWAQEGHQVKYVLLTKGDKGSSDPKTDPEALAQLRIKEQTEAAAVLGVKDIRFLDYKDGCLVPSLETRKTIAKVIREEKPDILVTCDPLNYYSNDVSINHPDHRAAGLMVLEGYFPAAGNPMYYPELMEEGLMPHSVKEVWVSIPFQPNVIYDVTAFWSTKLEALHHHRSQIGDIAQFDERMKNRRTPDSTPEDPHYLEKFKRLIYR